MTRKEEILDFLVTAGWEGAEITSLAGDASFRRYDRIKMDDKHAVLMDAPPEFEDTRPFVAIAEYLVSQGLRAPVIFAKDVERGFLLLEDLGDNLFKRVLDGEPEKEALLYRHAVDELVKLNHAPLYQDVSHYDQALYLTELALFTDWYYPALTGNRLPESKRAGFLNLWKDVLGNLDHSNECLVLRDYHAENLLDLDNGDVGQLDFQDAVIGHSAYDLVSLLQDARRDVDPATEQEMIEYFADALNRDLDDFKRDYAILGAQRNLKIIGIFARLTLRDGKDHYLSLEPRVWGLLERCLEHPILSKIKNWLDQETPDKRHEPLAPIPLMPNKAMILAAGLGTRMRPLTDHMPKVLIQVAGKEMLGSTLDALANAGIKKAVINKHHHAGQIDEFIENRKDWRPVVSFSDETDELLDSGGGVKKALSDLGNEPFYIFNSDMIWQSDGQDALMRLATRWTDEMDMLMLLIRRGEAHGHDGPGDFHMDENGKLDWRGDDDYSDFLYGGIMIIRPECFTDSPDGPFSLRLLFDRAVKAGKLYGMVHEGNWYHVGTTDAIAKTEKLLKGD
ncbi:phosphotransferase [Pseudemcibacter aquimaris]|uniref:phosphotransferase n=1 Tax=Pseudemcibacter aquimaris TaxID=2857064 RepID=UPI002012646D|nr:phosphotransferase [Pseudemcibacter aquimaris]MCC3860270.1 phosphotransferase [Pseudemcibacter aquimaris]WDU57595.1 phosphotransferase [Pseudemcibacter aquimaris]